jgi:hypothetical protein
MSVKSEKTGRKKKAPIEYPLGPMASFTVLREKGRKKPRTDVRAQRIFESQLVAKDANGSLACYMTTLFYSGGGAQEYRYYKFSRVEIAKNVFVYFAFIDVEGWESVATRGPDVWYEKMICAGSGEWEDISEWKSYFEQAPDEYQVILKNPSLLDLAPANKSVLTTVDAKYMQILKDHLYSYVIYGDDADYLNYRKIKAAVERGEMKESIVRSCGSWEDCNVVHYCDVRLIKNKHPLLNDIPFLPMG